MTLKEIAKRANVSISTVSRIINTPDGNFARKEIRDKVWEIIRDTGYVPNQSAIELKQNKTKNDIRNPITIACILGRTKTPEENPFFAQVVRAVEQKALSLGYVVALSYSILDIANLELLKKIESVKTDGAIIIGRFDTGTLKFLKNHYKNIVYVGRNVVDAELDQVICDGYEATKEALNYLLRLGHKRIGYIGETVNEIRYKAYLDTLLEKKLDNDRCLICSCPQTGAGGYQGADMLLKRVKPLPTAVFCATDVAAIGAIRRFTEAGIKIPKDISIIGMDDIELAGYVSPMLTTVGMPKAELGNMAVHILVSRLNKNHKLPMKLYLPFKLAVRESVTKCL
ncbi:LacI family DNA-binding transcriptional regulator [Anaerocolumna sp. AGMB13025]|uniref:LacI family DNA-binding transcriptional regulator n=1 Tax=Anaerocolumna sp. AGMB13025 TaxID=3039116 RepID=UPI0024200556|nr:LacI family DNA-binding transcriptional regulator [Anaerocolumna sp. AGMB13025]WFR59981.1 LacI family DNA-binding transcriptional regulator [Anaerocolumna sp. AGMB13025]